MRADRRMRDPCRSRVEHRCDLIGHIKHQRVAMTLKQHPMRRSIPEIPELAQPPSAHALAAAETDHSTTALVETCTHPRCPPTPTPSTRHSAAGRADSGRPRTDAHRSRAPDATAARKARRSRPAHAHRRDTDHRSHNPQPCRQPRRQSSAATPGSARPTTPHHGARSSDRDSPARECPSTHSATTA